MKSIFIYVLLVLLVVVDASAQRYICDVNKFAIKNDALPYGTMNDTDIKIVIDMDSAILTIHDKEIIVLHFDVLQSRVSNNGVLMRLGSLWADGNKCFIQLFIRDEKPESIEIKCLNGSVMYLSA